MRWVPIVARVGYAVKGEIYLLVGVLAGMFAAGVGGGKTTDPKGAIHTLSDLPGATVLLAGTAVGLAAFALWRFVEAIFDPEKNGKLTERLSHGGAGVLYGGFATLAFKLLVGAHDASKDTPQMTAPFLHHPLGRIGVAIVGVGLVVAALVQTKRAFTGETENHVKLNEMSKKERELFRAVARVGNVARAIVFALMGVFFVRAAIAKHAFAEQGMGGALHEIGKQPLGGAMLAAVAVGLVAYAASCFLRARYRWIPNTARG